MTTVVTQRIEAARCGENPYLIKRMASGWLVMGDVQTLPGYCLLLADPIVPSLNALLEPARAQYGLDMIRAGDALLATTSAYRINYETLANLDPVLHTHIIPRYADEPEVKRTDLAFRAYDWGAGRPFDPAIDRPMMDRIAAYLG